MARRRKRSAVDRALYHMRPNRVLARYLSGGKHQTFKSIVNAPFKERTVHTPKTGRRAYRQHVARERKERASKTAAKRRAVAAERKAQRAQQRRTQPRAPRPKPAPIAVNARTGAPITLRQAEAEYRRAERRVRALEDRLHEGILFDEPVRRPRKTAAAPPPTPLQAAIKEVKAKQRRKTTAKKTTAKKPSTSAGAKRTRSAAKPRPRKRASAKLGNTIAGLIVTRAVLAPETPGRTLPGAPALRPVPGKTRASRNARRGLYGAVLKKTCECAGTGRIPVYDEHGDPHGSVSCPVHGRGGTRRGSKRWTMRGAIRESGLPGLAARLQRKHTSKRGNSDARQYKAWETTQRQVRHAGPTLECGNCESGLVNKHLTDRLRKQHVMKARADAAAVIRAAQAHNAEVDETGEGKKMKVPKMPSEKQLQAAARLAYPYDLCSQCRGLGRVETGARLLQDGQQPVAEWRAAADLRKGHRPTGRERSTGRRPTENAARVERRRILPRI